MNRLSYIDWMRGLACVLMFQTHCYDSWLSPEARASTFFAWSQILGTFPAPLFLFLAGVSFALVTETMHRKGIARDEIVRKTIQRGAEVFGLALLFRVQEFLLGFRHAPWTDLLRVDILNLMGLSMVAMGILCWLAPTRQKSITAACTTLLGIILVTPLVWTTWRPRFLPWPIESYVNGVHIFTEPQPWLFPIFPWAGFAFAGLAAGFVLTIKNKAPMPNTEVTEARRTRSSSLWQTPAFLGILGAVIAMGAWLLDRLPVQVYPVYDFWHTSPNFFLIRLGLLLMILFGCFAWCEWGWGRHGFSPVMELGRVSLVVYWVHIQFVYGGLSILEKGAQTATKASIGLLMIAATMVGLAWGKRKIREARKKKAVAV